MKEPYVEALNERGEHIFSTEPFVVLAKTGGPRTTEVEVLVNATQSETFLFFVAFGMSLAKHGLLDEATMRLRSAVSGHHDHSESTQATITA